VSNPRTTVYEHLMTGYRYLIRVAVRVEESELDVADADGIEFLFDDRRCTTKEIRRAVRYGYLHL